MKPILFNTEMVQAILDGRKTATRRVVKPQHLKALESPYRKEHPEVSDKQVIEKLCAPPACTGDILYVRETWAVCELAKNGFIYRACFNQQNGDAEKSDAIFEWHPSIHMPKEAARIFLRVTDVRVERLQEITDEGAGTEGVSRIGEPRRQFAVLWETTIKKEAHTAYGWAANPWVWVIEFERCEKPEEARDG